MKTLPLSPHLSLESSPYSSAPRSLSGQLLGEIAERLLEWSEDVGRQRVHAWMLRVSTMASDPESVDAVWLYLRLMTGDLGQLTASFAELGAERHRSKQAQAQEHERALRVIARHFPECAEAIKALANRHA